jgi:hypothetical protein
VEQSCWTRLFSTLLLDASLHLPESGLFNASSGLERIGLCEPSSSRAASSIFFERTGASWRLSYSSLGIKNFHINKEIFTRRLTRVSYRPTNQCRTGRFSKPGLLHRPSLQGHLKSNGESMALFWNAEPAQCRNSGVRRPLAVSVG